MEGKLETLTLGELVPLHLAARSLRPASVRQRTVLLRRFVAATGDPLPGDLDAGSVVRWWADLRACNYATATLRAHHAAATTFVGWLCSLGLRNGNPVDALRRPPEPRSVPRALTDAQVDALLGCRMTPRLELCIALGLRAGLRVSEMTTLDASSVLWDGPVPLLRVHGKGGHLETVPVEDERLVELLAAWCATPGRWVPVSPNHLSTLIARQMTLAGVPETAHALRHTYATRLLRAGVDVRTVSARLRHSPNGSGLATTARYLAPL